MREERGAPPSACAPFSLPSKQKRTTPAAVTAAAAPARGVHHGSFVVRWEGGKGVGEKDREGRLGECKKETSQ